MVVKSGIFRKELVENLEKIRATKLCVFVNTQKRCDCKFGTPDGIPQRHSESFSGCAEVRQVMLIFKAMSDEEFDDLCIRADIYDSQAGGYSMFIP